MKAIHISSVMLCALGLAPLSTPSFSASPLTAAVCQPLTRGNLEKCCEAENWREIIFPNDFAACPPLRSDDTERLGNVAVIDGPGPGPGPGPDVVTGSVPGNPGNHKAVGAAATEKVDAGGFTDGPNDEAGNRGRGGETDTTSNSENANSDGTKNN